MEYVLFFLLLCAFVFQQWEISRLKHKVTLIELRYSNTHRALVKLLNAAQRAKTSKKE